LQTGQAPRRYWIQATSTRGLRACIRRVAGCATSTGFAAHAGATASLKLTFEVDHPAGANQAPPRLLSSPVGALSNSFPGRTRVSHDLLFRQRRQLAGPLKDASIDHDRINIFG